MLVVLVGNHGVGDEQTSQDEHLSKLAIAFPVVMTSN